MDEERMPVAAVAGASGFIGRVVVTALEADGYAVRLIGRSAPARWDDAAAVRRAVDGAEVVVNLAGRSVDCRYDDRHREEILRSRVDTTRALRRAIAAAERPPRIWLNASTATIYRHAMDRPQTEASGELGTGFSPGVARAWERELFEGELPATRRVALRMAIVIGDGPATRMLFLLARSGLGGPQLDGWAPPHRRYRGIGDAPTGDGRAHAYRTRGRQKFSWVHLDDVIGAIRFVRDHDEISGPVNVASPHPSDNRTLMRTLRRLVGMPLGIPVPRWMLELGTWLLRSEAELLVKSRWVVPEKLAAAGFAFTCPELEGALSRAGAPSAAATRSPRRGRA